MVKCLTFEGLLAGVWRRANDPRVLSGRLTVIVVARRTYTCCNSIYQEGISLMAKQIQEIFHSVCPLDCPDTCSITATVEENRLIAVHGSRSNPYTDGAICKKSPRVFPKWCMARTELGIRSVVKVRGEKVYSREFHGAKL